MERFGIVHWLIFLVFIAAPLCPISRVLKRVGLSPWWSILAMIPFVGWFSLWVFAFARWPKVDTVEKVESA